MEILNNHYNDDSELLVIMPIYNRREFLNRAFKSLRDQTYKKWNLIIVDDGSTDNYFALIKELSTTVKQKVEYIFTENGGPGKARSTGQKFLKNQRYVAFFDSDDYWLPTYLETMVSQLEKIPIVDWLFCPCKRLNYETGEVLLSSTGLNEKTKLPLSFRKLDHLKSHETCIYHDKEKLALTQLRDPLHAGFQNSVIRSDVIRDIKIPCFRVGEDRLFLISAILGGYKVGYIDKVEVLYFVHGNNLSNTNSDKSDLDKTLFVQGELCKSLQEVLAQTSNSNILREVERQIENINFWMIAYNGYWENGEYLKGLKVMAGVLFESGFRLRFLKTSIICAVKYPFLVVRLLIGKGGRYG